MGRDFDHFRRILRTSEEWYDEMYGDGEIEILDALGWDKRDFSYSWYHERISEQEFNMRILLSEINYKK